MKNILGSIISLLLGAGIITMAMFYLIPVCKKKPTNYVHFVDNISQWIKANWIWCLVIILTITLAFIVLYIGLIQKKIK